MPGVRDLIRDVDRRWGPPAGGPKIRLSIIGSTALMLQADYERGTKDSDVLQTAELLPEITSRLIALAGKETELHQRHRMYLEIVASGLPFLPQVPLWHGRPDLTTSLHHFEVVVLDVVDVVVSKLKRFNTNDVSDIEAMIDRDLVPHERLITRFRAAVDYYGLDSRAADLPRYVANLNRVERDSLGCVETNIELPDWV